MKRRLERIANTFKNEIQLVSNALIVGSFILILLAGRGSVFTDISLSSPPFLRGGRALFAPSSTTPLEEKQGPQSPVPHGFINPHRDIDAISKKIQPGTVKRWNEMQLEVTKQWSELNENVAREWGKLTSSVVRLISRENPQGTRQLDDVLRSFKSVLNGGEVNTAKLLKACRTHLILMKSGGAALRVVARDMEMNLNKAEALYERVPEEGKYLSSLLKVERESGVHDGNKLREGSAAMGLLWIRRSLAFQLDLYSSLIASAGRHPNEAAMDAYHKHLSPYHDWMLQKVFPLSFSRLPDRDVFIAKFGGTEVDQVDEEYESEIVKKLKALVNTWEPIICTWRDEYERLDLEDMRLA